ncbi:hypothetical protein [Symbioplanes lichenis]|uniref:hypothetical protein n=1 Tax=Symbioplanes lichenis TaxID=1629072 RepID=UPI0027396DEE|nr:hypothetical protein [Actinoplanes lichenis]
MDYMTHEAYDWVDDDELGLDATLGRLGELESVSVVTAPVVHEHEPLGSDVTGGASVPPRDPRSSKAFLDMQARIEKSTQLVLEEAFYLRRRQQRLLVVVVATVAAAFAVIAAAFLLSGSWESGSRATWLSIAFGAAPAILAVAVLQFSQSLSTSLFAEVSRETRAMQSISAALLIEDIHRRDKVIESLAERLVEQPDAPARRSARAPHKQNWAVSP